MTRSSRTARGIAAAVALAAITALTGCIGQPGTEPEVATTARAASAQQFACPTEAEVAALTAVPFTARTASDRGCAYLTAIDVDQPASVTLRHPADSVGGQTLAALRYAATRNGATTADLRRLAFDAFTASTAKDCTAWFPAADGVVTSVTAARAGVSGAKACDLATSVAVLAGSGARATAPTVAVLAPRRLLDETTSDAEWPWRIGRLATVRVDRLTGTGYLSPGASSSFAAVAAKVPVDSAAVVFVSGTAEAGAARLEILGGATAAFSAAATRAPKARLVVVGPLADGTASFAELAALRSDLAAAATIAGARYVDPSPDGVPSTGASAALDLLADDVSAALRAAGVQGE